MRVGYLKQWINNGSNLIYVELKEKKKKKKINEEFRKIAVN